MTSWLASLPRRLRRDALRTLRGRKLRTETYAFDGDLRSRRPIAVAEFLHGVAPLPIGAPWHFPEEWQTQVFFPHQLADRNTQWERGSDPMT
jgi:hypothetical protein